MVAGTSAGAGGAHGPSSRSGCLEDIALTLDGGEPVVDDVDTGDAAPRASILAARERVMIVMVATTGTAQPRKQSSKETGTWNTHTHTHTHEEGHRAVPVALHPDKGALKGAITGVGVIAIVENEIGYLSSNNCDRKLFELICEEVEVGSNLMTACIRQVNQLRTTM